MALSRSDLSHPMDVLMTTGGTTLTSHVTDVRYNLMKFVIICLRLNFKFKNAAPLIIAVCFMIFSKLRKFSTSIYLFIIAEVFAYCAPNLKRTTIFKFSFI